MKNQKPHFFAWITKSFKAIPKKYLFILFGVLISGCTAYNTDILKSCAPFSWLLAALLGGYLTWLFLTSWTQFNSEKIIAAFTGMLVLVGMFQLYTFEKTDQTLRAAQRPWIYVNDITTYDNSVYKNGAITFYVRLHLQNVGNSPAIVIAQAKAILNSSENWPEARDKECAALRGEIGDNYQSNKTNLDGAEKVKWGNRFGIPPKGTIQYAVPAVIDAKEFAKIDKVYSPTIVGCVLYFYEDSDKKPHQTPFTGRISLKDNFGHVPSINPIPIDATNVEIPPEKLAVMYVFNSGVID